MNELVRNGNDSGWKRFINFKKVLVKFAKILILRRRCFIFRTFEIKLKLDDMLMLTLSYLKGSLSITHHLAKCIVQ